MAIIIFQRSLFLCFLLVGCEISSETDLSVSLAPKTLETQNIESAQNRYRQTWGKIELKRDEEILRSRQENSQKNVSFVPIFPLTGVPELQRGHHERERKSVQNEPAKSLMFPR